MGVPLSQENFLVVVDTFKTDQVATRVMHTTYRSRKSPNFQWTSGRAIYDVLALACGEVLVPR